jgi:hypothetical protein
MACRLKVHLYPSTYDACVWYGASSTKHIVVGKVLSNVSKNELHTKSKKKKKKRKATQTRIHAFNPLLTLHASATPNHERGRIPLKAVLFEVAGCEIALATIDIRDVIGGKCAVIVLAPPYDPVNNPNKNKTTSAIL